MSGKAPPGSFFSLFPHSFILIFHFAPITVLAVGQSVYRSSVLASQQARWSVGGVSRPWTQVAPCFLTPMACEREGQMSATVEGDNPELRVHTHAAVSA